MSKPFRPAAGAYVSSRVLAELARLWDQAVHQGKQVQQDRLASQADVPISTVNSWVKGRSLPRDVDQLTRVGEVLAAWAGEKPATQRKWAQLLKADRDDRADSSAAPAGRSDIGVGRPLIGEARYDDVFDTLDRVRFTKRDWLTSDIDAFLEERSRGYLFIEGMAGAGKTSLLAWLAREHDCPHHFTANFQFRRSTGAALGSLGAQMVRRYQLDRLREELGAHLSVPHGFYRLLRRAAEAAKGKGRQDDRGEVWGSRLVLVVDGLDQADQQAPVPFGLPADLPDNVYVIGSCAEGFPPPYLTAPTDHIRIDIGAEETLDDLRRHVTAAVRSDPVLRDRLAGRAEEFPGALVRHCQGQWLLAEHLLGDIRAGRADPDDLPALPKTTWGDYTHRLEQLEVQDRTLAVRALSTLACAAEPLPLDTVEALAGIQDGEQGRRVRALVAGPLRQIVTAWRDSDGQAADQQQDLYYWMHDSARSYFTGWRPDSAMTGVEPQVDRLRQAAREARQRILDRYVLRLFGSWDDLSAASGPDPTGMPVLTGDPAELGRLDGGYGLRNLARHLEEAGSQDALHKLLTAEAVPAGGPEGAWVLVWYAAHAAYGRLDWYRADLARARRLAARAADEDQAAGRRAPAIGREVRYALMEASIATISSGRGTNLTPGLVHALVEARIWGPADAWDVIFPPRSTRAWAVAGQLLPCLPEPDRERIADHLLRVGLDPASGPARIQLLGMLGGCLSRHDRPEDLARVMDAVLAADSGDSSTCWALYWVLPHLPLAMVLQVHEHVADHNRYTGWGRVHRALALRLADEGRRLGWVAGHLTAELVALADNGCGLDSGPGPMPTRDTAALRTLLGALNDSRRCDVLATVLGRIAEDRHWGIAKKLAQVGGFLSGPQADHALRLARDISPVTHPGARAHALAALLPAVPTAQRAALAAEALRALPAAGSSDDHLRHDTLRMLAGHASGDIIARLPEMIDALDPQNQPEPLAVLATRTPAPVSAHLRRQAIEITEQHRGRRRAEILNIIAPCLDHHTRLRAFELLTGARYGDGDQQYRDQALDALVASTTDEEELRHAWRVATTIGDTLPQAATLVALARHIPTGKRRELGELVEELLAEAPPVHRADTLITLAAAFPADEQHEMLRRAADIIPAKRPVNDRRFVARLQAVRPVLTDQEIHNRLVAAVDEWRDRGGLDLWAALALPESISPRQLNKVMKAVRKRLWSDQRMAHYLAMIAPHLSGSELNKAISLAEQLHENVRDLPLAALACRLREGDQDGDRRRVIAQVMADMCDEERQGEHGPISVRIGVDAHAVAALAQAMTDDERDDLLGLLLDGARPRLGHVQRPLDLLAMTLPTLTPPQRTRALNAGAAMLPERVKVLGEDFSALALRADKAFLRKLTEATRFSPEDIKARAIATVLRSPAADPARTSWNNGTDDQFGPVRELLNDIARPGLLTVLQAAAPHIAHHGGQAAARECAHAIQDTAAWWP